MVKIGFDDEEETKELSEEDELQLEKHGKQKAVEKKMSVYIPERRMQAFLDEYDCVVVHDFGDDYHLSDEEKLENNQYYEVFKNFSRCKHKYRKLEQYVRAMREFFKCLDFIAEKNGVYEPEKFKLMYLKGKISINGLFMPKFVGREKKYISTDYLSEFILSDEPAENIIIKKADEVYTAEDVEEITETMFTKEELERLMEPETEEEMRLATMSFDEDDDDPYETNAVTEMKEKQVKKLLKNNPEFVKIIKDSKDKQRSIAAMSRYAYDITSEDLDYIEIYDRKHNLISSGEMPKFTGNIMNDDDYNKYMMELEEWESSHTYDNYHGKTKSLEEIRELELKTFLESNGWDLRNLYGNKDKEKRMKKQIKRDKKREKELRQKLVDISNRRKEREGKSSELTNKGKKKKKKSGKQKALDKEKKRMKNSFDDFIDASGPNSDCLDWT